LVVVLIELVLGVFAGTFEPLGLDRCCLLRIVLGPSLKHLTLVFQLALGEFDWATRAKLVASAAVRVLVLLVAAVVGAACFVEFWLREYVLMVIRASELVLRRTEGPLKVGVAACDCFYMAWHKAGLSVE